jgi:cytochrome c peroxidase
MKRASGSRAVQLQRFLIAPCALLLGAVACGSNNTEESALDRGRALFNSTELSRSTLNDNSCATCHDTAEPEGSIKPGASMASVTRRTSFWGGQENDLLRSINQCRSHFMLDNLPLEVLSLWHLA